MADQEQKLFAPVSLSAIGDRRLTGSHWRVYAAIAARDQLGANGQNCYIGHPRLASEASVDYTNLSKLIGNLEDWGYVSRARHPFDRRKRAYSLNYNDKNVIVGGSTNYPSRQPSRDEILGGFTNDQAEIVGGQNPQAIENIDPDGRQYIPLSGREKEKPPAAAPIESAAVRDWVPTGKQSRSDSAVETEEKKRAREKKIDELGGGDDATRRARLCLGGTHAAGGDDSAVETEEKKPHERKRREALASKGKGPDFHGWAEWLISEHGFDRRGAWEALMRWSDLADMDDDRLNAELFNALAEKPTDLEAFMVERLQAPES